MLTRKTALARLRATGTLGADGRKANTITKDQVNSPVTQSVQRLMIRNNAATGQRLLAPSAVQMVLP